MKLKDLYVANESNALRKDDDHVVIGPYTIQGKVVYGPGLDDEMSALEILDAISYSCPGVSTRIISGGKRQGYGHGYRVVRIENTQSECLDWDKIIYEAKWVDYCNGPGYSCPNDHGPWVKYGEYIGGLLPGEYSLRIDLRSGKYEGCDLRTAHPGVYLRCAACGRQFLQSTFIAAREITRDGGATCDTCGKPQGAPIPVEIKISDKTVGFISRMRYGCSDSDRLITAMVFEEVRRLKGKISPDMRYIYLSCNNLPITLRNIAHEWEPVEAEPDWAEV
jgi:DNA-directed RNA polymerase subunit RPC12/RpoP